jgi:hypothetical protein
VVSSPKGPDQNPCSAESRVICPSLRLADATPPPRLRIRWTFRLRPWSHQPITEPQLSTWRWHLSECRRKIPAQLKIASFKANLVTTNTTAEHVTCAKSIYLRQHISPNSRHSCRTSKSPSQSSCTATPNFPALQKDTCSGCNPCCQTHNSGRVRQIRSSQPDLLKSKAKQHLRHGGKHVPSLPEHTLTFFRTQFMSFLLCNPTNGAVLPACRLRSFLIFTP